MRTAQSSNANAVRVQTVAALPRSQPVPLLPLSAVCPRPVSLIGLKPRPRTQAWDGPVLEVSEATLLVAGGTMARKCAVAQTAFGTDLIS